MILSEVPLAASGSWGLVLHCPSGKRKKKSPFFLNEVPLKTTQRFLLISLQKQKRLPRINQGSVIDFFFKKEETVKLFILVMFSSSSLLSLSLSLSLLPHPLPRTEPKASGMPGKCCTTKPHPQPTDVISFKPVTLFVYSGISR